MFPPSSSSLHSSPSDSSNSSSPSLPVFHPSPSHLSATSPPPTPSSLSTPSPSPLPSPSPSHTSHHMTSPSPSPTLSHRVNGHKNGHGNVNNATPIVPSHQSHSYESHSSDSRVPNNMTMNMNQNHDSDTSAAHPRRNRRSAPSKPKGKSVANSSMGGLKRSMRSMDNIRSTMALNGDGDDDNDENDSDNQNDHVDNYQDIHEDSEGGEDDDNEEEKDDYDNNNRHNNHPHPHTSHSKSVDHSHSSHPSNIPSTIPPSFLSHPHPLPSSDALLNFSLRHLSSQDELQFGGSDNEDGEGEGDGDGDGVADGDDRDVDGDARGEVIVTPYDIDDVWSDDEDEELEEIMHKNALKSHQRKILQIQKYQQNQIINQQQNGQRLSNSIDSSFSSSSSVSSTQSNYPRQMISDESERMNQMEDSPRNSNNNNNNNNSNNNYNHNAFNNHSPSIFNSSSPSSSSSNYPSFYSSPANIYTSNRHPVATVIVGNNHNMPRNDSNESLESLDRRTRVWNLNNNNNNNSQNIPDESMGQNTPNDDNQRNRSFSSSNSMNITPTHISHSSSTTSSSFSSSSPSPSSPTVLSFSTDISDPKWLHSILSLGSAAFSHSRDDTPLLYLISKYLLVHTKPSAHIHIIHLLLTVGSPLLWYLSSRINQILVYISLESREVSNTPPNVDSICYLSQICEFIFLFTSNSTSVTPSLLVSAAYTSLKSAMNTWIHSSSKLLNQMKDEEIALTEACGMSSPYVPDCLRSPSNYTYKHSVNELVYSLNMVSTHLATLLVPSSKLIAKLRVGHWPHPIDEWQREMTAGEKGIHSEFYQFATEGKGNPMGTENEKEGKQKGEMMITHHHSEHKSQSPSLPLAIPSSTPYVVPPSFLSSRAVHSPLIRGVNEAFSPHSSPSTPSSSSSSSTTPTSSSLRSRKRSHGNKSTHNTTQHPHKQINNKPSKSNIYRSPYHSSASDSSSSFPTSSEISSPYSTPNTHGSAAPSSSSSNASSTRSFALPPPLSSSHLVVMSSTGSSSSGKIGRFDVSDEEITPPPSTPISLSPFPSHPNVNVKHVGFQEERNTHHNISMQSVSMGMATEGNDSQMSIQSADSDMGVEDKEGERERERENGKGNSNSQFSSGSSSSFTLSSLSPPSSSSSSSRPLSWYDRISSLPPPAIVIPPTLNVPLCQWLFSLLSQWSFFPKTTNISPHIQYLSIQISDSVSLMQHLSWPLHKVTSHYAYIRSFLEYLMNNPLLSLQLLSRDVSVEDVIRVHSKRFTARRVKSLPRMPSSTHLVLENLEVPKIPFVIHKQKTTRGGMVNNAHNDRDAPSDNPHSFTLFPTPPSASRHLALYRLLLAAVILDNFPLLKYFRVCGIFDEFLYSSQFSFTYPPSLSSHNPNISIPPPIPQYELNHLLPYASPRMLEWLVSLGADVHVPMFRSNVGEENIKEHEQLSVYVSFIVFVASSRNDGETVFKKYSHDIQITEWECGSVCQYALLTGQWDLAHYAYDISQSVTMVMGTRALNATRLKSWIPAPTTSAGQHLLHSVTPDYNLKCGLFSRSLDCLYHFFVTRPSPILRGSIKYYYLYWWSFLVVTIKSPSSLIHQDLYMRIRQSTASGKNTNWSRFMMEMYAHMVRLEQMKQLVMLMEKCITKGKKKRGEQIEEGTNNNNYNSGQYQFQHHHNHNQLSPSSSSHPSSSHPTPQVDLYGTSSNINVYNPKITLSSLPIMGISKEPLNYCIDVRITTLIADFLYGKLHGESHGKRERERERGRSKGEADKEQEKDKGNQKNDINMSYSIQ